MYSLRRLENSDIELVKRWLEEEHVATWFGDSSPWIEELYGRDEEYKFIRHFIVASGKQPVGFCQYYDYCKLPQDEPGLAEPQGTYGIDYMIGEIALLGKGIGKQIVKMICDKVFEENTNVFQIVADPTIEEDRINTLSIKVLEANGFVYHKKSNLYKKPVSYNHTKIIEDQTNRALWEIKNVIDCVPDPLWNKEYCQMPCWKHIYHMLHSLDLWYINPRDVTFKEPSIHETDLNNLDVISSKSLSREDINHYLTSIDKKIHAYISHLTDEQLLEHPQDCEYCKFTLILAQFRHLHTHMGMIMGFIVDDTGFWPRVLGLETPFPHGAFSKYL